MGIAENIGYIIIGFIAIVVVFLIMLSVLEKKLHLRFLQGKKYRNKSYIEKLSKLNPKNTENSLRILDKTSKNFFREAFHLKGNPEYSELSNIFAKKNNKKAIKFCDTMTKYLYSRETITKKELHDLIALMAEIVSANRIITKREKKELDKKSLKLSKKSRKSDKPGVRKKIDDNKKDKTKKDKVVN
jgi:hypothetical protein